jgi:hypothetical protein
MMDPSADPAVLLTVVTTSEEGSHKINIYGTPSPFLLKTPTIYVQTHQTSARP